MFNTIHWDEAFLIEHTAAETTGATSGYSEYNL